MPEPDAKQIDAIMIAEKDNVATCLNDIESGAQVTVMLGEDTRTVAALDPIPRGHKLAVRDIAEGESVLKYGEIIGKASSNIGMGLHVHTHNVVD
jgi:altronate dehydratase